jgi:hypothetical protein
MIWGFQRPWNRKWLSATVSPRCIFVAVTQWSVSSSATRGTDGVPNPTQMARGRQARHLQVRVTLVSPKLLSASRRSQLHSAICCALFCQSVPFYTLQIDVMPEKENLTRGGFCRTRQNLWCSLFFSFFFTAFCISALFCFILSFLSSSSVKSCISFLRFFHSHIYFFLCWFYSI